MGQKLGFYWRVKAGVRFKKSTFWVQKVHFVALQPPPPPKVDSGYGPDCLRHMIDRWKLRTWNKLRKWKNPQQMKRESRMRNMFFLLLGLIIVVLKKLISWLILINHRDGKKKDLFYIINGNKCLVGWKLAYSPVYEHDYHRDFLQKSSSKKQRKSVD